MTSKTKGQAAEKALETDGGLISNEKLRLLYSTMLKCRLLKERLRVLAKQGKLAGDYDGALGLEAAAAGTMIDLRAEDALAPSRHDFIAGWIKGVPLDKVFRPLLARNARRGKYRSSSERLGYGELNVIAPASTISAQLHVAIGVALANKMAKSGHIAMAYSGAGMASLEDWQEALHYAGVNDLPIVFVCANNLSEDAADRMRQANDAVAGQHDFPVITVDGNDVAAVYRVASEALGRARRGFGPTLIACTTLQWSVNSTEPLDAGAEERWKANDPVTGMERYLTGKRLFSAEWKQEISKAFNSELDAAIAKLGRGPV